MNETIHHMPEFFGIQIGLFETPLDVDSPIFTIQTFAKDIAWVIVLNIYIFIYIYITISYLREFKHLRR